MSSRSRKAPVKKDNKKKPSPAVISGRQSLTQKKIDELINEEVKE